VQVALAEQSAFVWQGVEVGELLEQAGATSSITERHVR
jgi:DMSO/TMAO reductase YedYZ molybdopterin-dependent catalytic subunit